jgi:hypothetical protein
MFVAFFHHPLAKPCHDKGPLLSNRYKITISWIYQYVELCLIFIEKTQKNLSCNVHHTEIFYLVTMVTNIKSYLVLIKIRKIILVAFWIFNFFNYGTFVVNFFILNGSKNMKHLFSIQNDVCCKKNLYIVYVMYHIYAPKVLR